MAGFNLFGNYQKAGPGIGKSGDKSYGFSGFWRIYKSKFFNLLALNLIYCVCVAVVVAIGWFPLNQILGSNSKFMDKLESYNVDSTITTVAERFITSYNIEDDKLDKVWPYFDAALNRIKTLNESALADGFNSGKLSGFDSKQYKQDDLNFVGDNLKKGFSTLGFSVKCKEGTGVTYYYISDTENNKVATLTVTGSESKKITFEHSLPYSVLKVAQIMLCFAPIILLGPINMGMTRLTRDYVREEPTFMMSDFWDTIKHNWWQSLIISLIQYVTVGCSILSLVWYYTFINSGFFFIVGFAGCLFLSYVFISMNLYVPLMQVTLDLNLRKIYKNAFYFTVIAMLKNVVMIVITAFMIALVAALVVLGMSYTLVLSLTITMVLIMFFAFWFYMVSYFAYPSIQKFIIDPYYEKQNKTSEKELNNNKSDSDGESQITSDGNDDSDINASSEDSEYVYYNGRMVHRSVLEQETLFEDDVTVNNSNKEDNN